MSHVTVELITYTLCDQTFKAEAEDWFAVQEWDIEMARSGIDGDKLAAGTELKRTTIHVRPDVTALELQFDSRQECFVLYTTAPSGWRRNTVPYGGPGLGCKFAPEQCQDPAFKFKAYSTDEEGRIVRLDVDRKKAIDQWLHGRASDAASSSAVSTAATASGIPPPTSESQ